MHKSLIVLLSATLLCSLSMSPQATVPEGINYQAYLTDSAGAPIDTSVSITFSLYTVDAGGTPIWIDTQVVTPVQGLFSTTLGADPLNLFPIDMFDTEVYAGLTVGIDLEMTPRQALTPNAYAYKALDAEALGGLSSSALQRRVSDECVAGASIRSINADGSVVCDDDDTGPWDLNGSSAVYTDGKLGIGTSAPSDFVQIDAAATTNAFRVRIGGSTKLRVNSNGSVTVGTLGAGPANGLYVAGGIGLGTSAPVGKLQTIPLGNLNNGGVLNPAGAGLIVGTSSTGIAMDANQIESMGSDLNLNFNSINDIIAVVGGGRLGVGTNSPSSKVDIESEDDWQLTLNNPGVGGNNWYVGSSRDTWAAGGSKFLISPTGSSTNSALSITAAKLVGIGTTDAATKLHVNGGSDVSGAGGGYVTVGNTTSLNIGIDNNEIMARDNGVVGTLFLQQETGGKVSINTSPGSSTRTFNLSGNANFYLGATEDFILDKSPSGTDPALYPTASEFGLIGKSGNEMFNIRSKRFYAESAFNYLAYSDRRLKQNIRPIAGALEAIARLDGMAYGLRPEFVATVPSARAAAAGPAAAGSAKEAFLRENQMGLIAQDVEKVLPQLVQTDNETGYKTVSYMGFIPLLVEAVKTQKRQIESQEQVISNLQARLDALERRLPRP